MYHYRRWHSDSPEHVQKMRKEFKGLISGRLPEDHQARILEIGCGMGFALLALKDLGYQNAEGIDIDADQVKSCLSKNLNVRAVKDSKDFLSDKKGFYDAVLAFDLIEHIPQDEQLELVRAIFEALRPGGRLLCTVPNANSALAGRWRYIDWTHRTSFTEISLDFLLHNAGFSKVRILESGSLPRFSYQKFLSKEVLKKSFWGEILHRCLHRAMRRFRRLEMIAELGFKEGLEIPLSLNLFCIARKDKEKT